MRVNLITKSCSVLPATGPVPLSLTIRPACGLPGDYEYSTDSKALLQMLHKHTDLAATIIKRFEGDIHSTVGARLLGVELNDRALMDIGYFID